VATIVSIDLVEKLLVAIRKRSRMVASILKKRLEAVETNPSAFDAVNEIPDWIAAILASGEEACIRKVKITHGRHDYRLLFLHHRPATGEEYADFF
jgi:hypothetical protein